MSQINVIKPLKLVPFRHEWAPSLCEWIQDLKELAFWSGKTFIGQEFSASAVIKHLKNKNIISCAGLDRSSNIIAYGEIVKKDSHNRLNFCRIIIHPNKRGQGLGKLFIHALVEKSKTLGSYSSIRLNVLSGNKPAIFCYSALGFKKIGKLPQARIVGNQLHDLIIMAQPLH